MEDPDPSLFIASIALSLALLAFTSAVDAAFTAINRHRLTALTTEGSTRTRLISRLIDDPYRFRATIIVLNSVATITATASTLTLFHPSGFWSQIGSLGILLLLMLVVSETLPKAFAIRYPDKAAVMLAGPLSFFASICWPLIALIGILTKPFFRLISGGHVPTLPFVTEEEVRLMVNVGEEAGMIEHTKREMIEGVFSLDDTIVRKLMVPRVDILAIEVDTPFAEALEVIIHEGHSRIPVYSESLDTILGILYSKDLIPTLRAEHPGTTLRNLIRPAHFVPETIKVDALFKDLRKRHVHMAIIVDEYGGTAGLITIEDLLEQIVGDIQDEYDTEEPTILHLSETELIVDGRVSLDELNQVTGLHLETPDADRIGGLVYQQLGRMTRTGDQVVLDEVTIEVLSVQGMRPHRLRITYPRQLAVSGAYLAQIEGANAEPT